MVRNIKAKDLEEGMTLRLSLKKNAKIETVQQIEVPITKKVRCTVVSYVTKDGATRWAHLDGNEEIEVVCQPLISRIFSWAFSKPKEKKEQRMIVKSGDIGNNLPFFLAGAKK